MSDAGGAAPPRPAIDVGRPDDVEACVALWVTTVAEREGGVAPDGTAERSRSKFARRPVSFVVARTGTRAVGDSGGLVGFGLVTAPGTGMAADPPDAAYLGMLAVAPRSQGRGLGARLLERLESDARKAGHAALVLHVLTSNTAAVSLYRSRGWAELGEPFPHPLTGAATQTYELRFG